ncbi:MAG: L,D-transpeptidase family protein [Hyphomicrobiaceae bacterium]
MMLYRCLAALVLSVAAATAVVAEDNPVPSPAEAARAASGDGSEAQSTDSTASPAPTSSASPTSTESAASSVVEQPKPTAATENAQLTPAETLATPQTPAATSDTASAPAKPGPTTPADETAPPPRETATATTPASGEGGGLDAVPAEADPLTPPPENTSPTRAPGAPERPAVARSIAEVDPFITALRARLTAWPESRAKSDQEDLAALKAYYGESDAARVWTTSNGLSPRAEAAVSALQRADEWGLDAAAFDLPARPSAGALPEALVDVEIRIGLEVLKYARHARGGRTDPAAISRIIDMRPHLYEPRSIIEAIAEAPSADAYLEGLHPRHAGFVSLKGALAKLRTEHRGTTANSDQKQKSKREISSEERRIIVNLERWRWLPDNLGEFYVWDNIPEQFTKVYHDGKMVHQAKIVVGKPSTPTPIFSSPMRFIIFHPSWGVPDGIKSNELGPMLRRSQAYSSGWFFSDNDGASRALRRHQLRVYLGGREVNPDSVNWSSVDIRRFSFTQPPSSSNVLGVVKFRFPNKHDVYMHDTTERNLFARTSRVFSHGCMRVEDPLKLASTILAYDKGWSRERVSQIVARGGTTDVTIDKRVNVHIVYFTATADPNGKVHSFKDVYSIDSRVASALAGRSVVLSSAHTDDDVQPSRPQRRATAPPQKARRQAAGAAPKPVGQKQWNPFSSGFGN